MLIPWFTAVVHGPSMVPTLRHGDVLLIVRTRKVRPGDIAVARFQSRPDLLVVKRVQRVDGQLCWLVGDNPLIRDDSRTYGVAQPVGRVLLRCWPRPLRIKGGLGH